MERFDGDGDLVVGAYVVLLRPPVNLLSQDEDLAAALRLMAFFSSV